MNKNHNPSKFPTLDLIISARKAYHKPCPAKNYPIILVLHTLYSSLNLLERTLNSHQPSKRYGTRKTHQCTTETKILKEKTQVQPPMSFDPIRRKRQTHALDKIRRHLHSPHHPLAATNENPVQFLPHLLHVDTPLFPHQC